MSLSLDGEYQSMQEEVVTVTVTATVGGMLPVKEGGTLLAQSKVSAEILVFSAGLQT